MKRIHKFIWVGAFIAVAVAISTVMGIVYSYASPSETEETNEPIVENQVYTISFKNGGTAPEGSYDIQHAGESCNPFTTNPLCDYYTLSIESDNRLMITEITTGGRSAYTYVFPVTLDSSVTFEGWGTIPEGQQSSNIILYPIFNKAEVTFNSAVISGKVKDKSSGATLANAPVYLAAENTGVPYVSTTTNSNGEYTLNNVKPEWINDDDNNPFTLYSTSPGYGIGTAWFNPENPERIEGNIAYYEDNDMILSVADVNVSGAEHHQIFDIEIVVHRPDGDATEKYQLPYFGLRNNSMSEGAELVIDENGLIKGTAKTIMYGVEVKIDIKCQAICDDGYKFSYADVNGTKYNAGEPIVIDGTSKYDGVIYYTPVEQIAQTGDAIPFVAIAGLGMVAVVAYVVARKRFN